MYQNLPASGSRARPSSHLAAKRDAMENMTTPEEMRQWMGPWDWRRRARLQEARPQTSDLSLYIRKAAAEIPADLMSQARGKH